MKNIKRSLIMVLLLGGLSAGCFNQAEAAVKKQAANKVVKPIVKTVAKTSIKKFTDLNEFKKFIENNVSLVGVNPGLFTQREMGASGGIAAPTTAMPTADVSAKTTSPSTDYSQTNVQTAGVDEADIVKTDGRYIFTVSQKDLFIIDAVNPQATKLVATISFQDQPEEIYLSGDKLIVIGHDYNFYPIMKKMNFIRRSAYTFVKVFDVSDKAKPKEVRSLRMEGEYGNSRVINNYLYLITNTYDYLWDVTALPRIYENNVLITATKTTARYAMPNIYYFDAPYRNLNLTNVSAVNLVDDKQAIKTELYALPGNETLYGSTNALYIAYGKYLDQGALMTQVMIDTVVPKLSVGDQEKIKQIKAVDKYILSDDEKLAKSGIIAMRYLNCLAESDKKAVTKQIEAATKAKFLTMLDQLQVTVIHKIAVKGATFAYQGMVEVPGRVLNQFALDESDGKLRVATTRDSVSVYNVPGLATKQTSSVYLINEQMKITGKLEGLAPEERIYAVRFMQNRAYLVTFKQTDPLFVIDVSGAAPKVLGELKVPGFSQYLHPYNDHLLIGLGKSTDLIDGRVLTRGLKLTLFDVTDVTKPTEIAGVDLGGRGSDSLALTDHRAFLFSRAKKLIAIPATLTKESADGLWGETEFNGALIFKVDDKSLSLAGRVTHNSELDVNNYQNGISRALYIDDNLYTVSDNYLQVNRLDNLTELNKLPLRQGTDYKIIN